MSTDGDDAITLTDIPQVARPFRLQYEEAQQSWVLLYPEGMIKLNQSAGEILKRCDATRDVAELIALLETEFEQQGLDSDVIDFLTLARQQGWITVQPGTAR